MRTLCLGLFACAALALASSLNPSRDEAAADEKKALAPQLGVPTGLILEVGTRYRYELVETARSVETTLLKRGADAKLGDQRSTITWDVEMLVVDSSPKGAELAVVIKRVSGKVSKSGKRSKSSKPVKFDSALSPDPGGLVAIAEKESRVKIDSRGTILAVSGAALALVPERWRDDSAAALRYMRSLFERFVQTLPEAESGVGDKWKTTRLLDAYYPPESRNTIGEFETQLAVRGMDQRVATLAIKCGGKQKSPRADHKKGKRGEEPRFGRVRESWKFSGKATVDLGTGQIVTRELRGKSSTYLWHYKDETPRMQTHVTHELKSKLRLVETIPPGGEPREGSGDDPAKVPPGKEE